MGWGLKPESHPAEPLVSFGGQPAQTVVELFSSAGSPFAGWLSPQASSSSMTTPFLWLKGEVIPSLRCGTLRAQLPVTSDLSIHPSVSPPPLFLWGSVVCPRCPQPACLWVGVTPLYLHQHLQSQLWGTGCILCMFIFFTGLSPGLLPSFFLWNQAHSIYIWGGVLSSQGQTGGSPVVERSWQKPEAAVRGCVISHPGGCLRRGMAGSTEPHIQLNRKKLGLDPQELQPVSW